MRKTIALTGGGTGGHIFPLLSVYNYLKEDSELEFLWVGEKLGMEKKIADENNIKFLDIKSGKIRRYFDWKNFYEPFKNIIGFFQGINHIYKNKIDIIFSKGGFVSLPLCIAGKIMRKKIYIHESDMVSGMANKWVGKIATKIFYTFPKEEGKELLEKEKIIGQILNPELIENIEDIEIKKNEKLEVLVIAGSQGSTIIFTELIKIIPNLPNINFTISLGEKNLHFRENFSNLENVKLYDFIAQKELGELYKKTDIAITRAGATTLWELYYFGIHSLIIPLKSAAGNHQNKNAKYFKDNFESEIFDEDAFSYILQKKLESYKDLRKESLNLEGFFDAIKVIEEEIKH